PVAGEPHHQRALPDEDLLLAGVSFGAGVGGHVVAPRRVRHRRRLGVDVVQQRLEERNLARTVHGNRDQISEIKGQKSFSDLCRPTSVIWNHWCQRNCCGLRAEPCDSTTLTSAGPGKSIASSSAPRMSFGFSTKKPLPPKASITRS